MIPLIIVDDEIMIRVGLKTMIQWEDHGFELIGEAANGMEALDIVRDLPYYIVLTDIRMPVMDGLELLQNIMEQKSMAKVLILSNHNEFEFVQKALQWGASDYLLKLTMEPPQLLDKLNRVKLQLEQDIQMIRDDSMFKSRLIRYSREAKENRLRDLLTKRCSRSDFKDAWEEFQLPGLTEPYQIVRIVIDDYENVVELNKFKSERLLNYAVTNILEEIMKKYGNGDLIPLEGGHYAVLQQTLEPIMMIDMQRATDTLLRLGLSFGISMPCSEIYAAPLAYEQAQLALEYRFYEGQGQILWYNSLPALSDTHSVPFREEKLWERWTDENKVEQLRELLNKWVAELRADAAVKPDHIRECWLHLMNECEAYCKRHGGDIYSVAPYMERYPHHVLRNAETLGDIHEWFSGWLAEYLTYVGLLIGMKWKPEVQVVVDYIEEHYMHTIKVSELADQAGFVPNYLSGLFKKETGETITDFITRIRMDKARAMLKDPAYKIYEISENVGYSDPNHFSKLFKKVEGMYPTEFRKLFLHRE
jgi:two-component system response regulator YesN